MIQSFWREILKMIEKINGGEVKQDPWWCLLHTTGESRKKYRTTMTPYLLNGAKALIPRQWKSKKIPSVKKWLREVDKIRLMEELLSIQNDCRPRFNKIWKG